MQGDHRAGGQTCGDTYVFTGIAADQLGAQDADPDATDGSQAEIGGEAGFKAVEGFLAGGHVGAGNGVGHQQQHQDEMPEPTEEGGILHIVVFRQ